VGPRFRVLTWIGSALAVVVLCTSLVWLAAPELSPYAAGPNPAPISHLFGAATPGRTAAALLQAAVGVAGSLGGLMALFGRRARPTLIGVVGVTSGMLAAVGLIGLNGLAICGYVLAYGLPFGILALLVWAARARTARAVLTIAGVAVAVFLVLGPTPSSALCHQFGGYVASDPIRFTSPLLLLLFSGAWVLIGAVLRLRTPGALGHFVLAHRVAITVAAACCALPYVLARLSWLTPWPLAGNPGDHAEDTLTLATGLVLGSGMLTGGILTLGLILPWGVRFPRWFGRTAGKQVPLSLAVIPASIIAILFTTAGLDSLLLAGAGGIGVDVLVTALVFPFWLWGPLLALATWGYALHRRTEPKVLTAPTITTHSTRHGDEQ
jgi:hypothetical protein